MSLSRMRVKGLTKYWQKKAKHEPDYFAPALVVLVLHHQHTQGAQIFFFPGHYNPLTESQNWVLVSLLGFWD